MNDDIESGPGEELGADHRGNPIGSTKLFGLIGSVGEGETIPSWHGVWNYDFADNRAHTAFVGLNLILSFGMAILSWIKNGGLNVAANPRQAFVDGLNAGREEAFRELPAEIELQHREATARYETARKMALLYTPHVALRTEVIRIIEALEYAQGDATSAPMIPAALVARGRSFAARARAVYRDANMPIDNKPGADGEASAAPPA